VRRRVDRDVLAAGEHEITANRQLITNDSERRSASELRVKLLGTSIERG